MRWTNQLGLPDPVVAAVKNDRYDDGGSDFTVTGLIGPPRIRVLRKRHSHELTEDVADRIYSLLGQSVHTILERSAVKGALAEVRLFTKIDGLNISGQLDHMVFFPDGLLQDYKLTSIWTELTKPEWVQQLNMLAFLLHVNGYEVARAEIVAIYRDWSKSRARREPDYPRHQVKLVDIELWPHERTLAFIRERIQVHVDAETLSLPECTDEERWYRGEQWALMKKGNKRATTLHDFKKLAEEDAEKRGKDYTVEHRPGKPTRCLDYCQAADFCDQHQAWLKANP